MASYGSKKSKKYRHLTSNRASVDYNEHADEKLGTAIDTAAEVKYEIQRRKHQAEIEFKQKVAEILKLQDDYQRKQQKDKEQSAEYLEFVNIKSEADLGSQQCEDSDSDQYPPSKPYNIACGSTLAWVDSLTSSLNSSMNSQCKGPGPVAESCTSHSTQEEEEVSFQGRILTEELVTKVSTEKQNCIIGDNPRLSFRGSDNSGNNTSKEDKYLDKPDSLELVLNPRTLMSTNVSTTSKSKESDQSNDATKQRATFNTDSNGGMLGYILTPEETHDLIEHLQAITRPQAEETTPICVTGSASISTINTLHLTADDTDSWVDEKTGTACSFENDDELNALHKTLRYQLDIERQLQTYKANHVALNLGPDVSYNFQSDDTTVDSHDIEQNYDEIANYNQNRSNGDKSRRIIPCCIIS